MTSPNSQQLLERLTQVFDLSPDGNLLVRGSLHLADKAGNVYCTIGADLDGGYIHLKNTSGKMAVSLGTTPDGGFMDIHFAESSMLAATICVNASGKTQIEVYDQAGNTQFIAPPESK